MTEGLNSGPAVVILAAGHGTRMGGPKAFKEHGGLTFLERLLDRCEESASLMILTVDPLFRDRIGALLDKRKGPRPKIAEADGLLPMLETVRAALAVLESGLSQPNPDQAPWDGGFWLWPVDAPFLTPAGWARACAAVREAADSVWKLRVRGKTGHPIWFPGWSVTEIRHGTWPNGLLGFLEAHADRVRLLPLDGEVIADFNTPDSLRDAPNSG